MIFAVSLLALIFFVGLAIDAGVMYVNYGQIKRAVDASVVAAANDFKRGETVYQMYKAAEEIMELHNVDMTRVDMRVYICDAFGPDINGDGQPDPPADGLRDAYLATAAPNFYARCPRTESPYLEAPRKLVYTSAHQRAPLYFLTLLGFGEINLYTDAIAEAAPVELVIVFDISESMGKNTTSPSPYVVDLFDPDILNGCNDVNSCQPLRQAKDAAKALVSFLYEGYDRVSIVTFDSRASVLPIRTKSGVLTSLTDDIRIKKATDPVSQPLSNLEQAINGIRLHDDPPFARMWPQWKNTPGVLNISTGQITGANIPVFNPFNAEDRDGDGADTDPGFWPPCDTNPSEPDCCVLDADRWDATNDPYGWGGVPCDADYYYDAYDWNGDGTYTPDNADNSIGVAWMAKYSNGGANPVSFSPLSTCTGCGMRSGADVLKDSGRPNAVWVMVFLSDGVVNLSDTHETNSAVPGEYTSGFCYGSLIPPGYPPNQYPDGFWPDNCIDYDPANRYCIDTAATTCPNDYFGVNIVWTGDTPDHQYSVLDYVLDMTDYAALTRSTNLDEPSGNDIAIYAIGLGDARLGEGLLRYMAAVGDDGDRATDPCFSVASERSCGQYYYAPSGDALRPIFEDIATRIYTRITE